MVSFIASLIFFYSGLSVLTWFCPLWMMGRWDSWEDVWNLVGAEVLEQFKGLKSSPEVMQAWTRFSMSLFWPYGFFSSSD